MTQDEDLFTLIIKNPETADSGRYTCVIRECNDLTCKAALDVERKNFTDTYLKPKHVPRSENLGGRAPRAGPKIRGGGEY